MTYQKIIKVLGLPDGSDRQSSAEKNKIFFVLYLTHPHIMRHTACTRMAEKRMDVKVLQYIMGHAHIDVTMDVYNHVSEMSRIESEITRLENVAIS